MRKASVERKTAETEISINLDLDGTGRAGFDPASGFLFHMLDAFCRFSLIDVELKAKGDLKVDDHHMVEDSGFVLGCALREALGDMRGVRRCGSAYFAMDEALARAVIDFSGRPMCLVKGKKRAMPAGSFTRELFREFFEGLCRGAKATLHLDLLRGSNGHHLYEAGFKAAARAVMDAVSVMERAKDRLPSTKGSLDGYGSGAGETPRLGETPRAGG
jgi:imidazoleglycerol-phosphate dehydratase